MKNLFDFFSFVVVPFIVSICIVDINVSVVKETSSTGVEISIKFMLNH